MQCLVLAGGFGTRLGRLTADRPKALVRVAGQPFAHWQLHWLAEQGVDRVVFSVGHFGEAIRDFVGDGLRWGLDVAYSDEGERLRGTAGAVRLAADLGLLDDHFFILYGDSYLSVELSAVERTFTDSGHSTMMTVYRNDGRFDRSNVVFRSGEILRYEKGLADPPPDMQYIDYGLTVVQRDVIEQRVPSGVVADLAPMFQALSEEGLLAGFEVVERFYEVGSPTGLKELTAVLEGRTGSPD